MLHLGAHRFVTQRMPLENFADPDRYITALQISEPLQISDLHRAQVTDQALFPTFVHSLIAVAQSVVRAYKLANASNRPF
jgi:hypothetical protein